MVVIIIITLLLHNLRPKIWRDSAHYNLLYSRGIHRRDHCDAFCIFITLLIRVYYNFLSSSEETAVSHEE